MIREKVLEILAGFGFKLEEVEGLGHVFEYEGMKLIYLSNESDERFLDICLPNVYSCEEDNMSVCLALADKINSMVKYLKASIVGSCLVLSYERELIGDENLELVLQHMIACLESNMQFVRNAIAQVEEFLSHDDDTDKE